MKIAKGMIKIGPFLRVILYSLCVGLTVPNFNEYLYYWKLEEANLT